ncbi:MAG TPA: hypothetical protein VNO79_11890 [Actinomycetota bacterium]|nr:hypothetical protein [Actinomycetota bacterium]
MGTMLVGLGLGWAAALAAVGAAAALRAGVRWVRFRRDVRALLRAVDALASEADGSSQRRR